LFLKNLKINSNLFSDIKNYSYICIEQLKQNNYGSICRTIRKK
jgi:hypothetical protein